MTLMLPQSGREGIEGVVTKHDDVNYDLGGLGASGGGSRLRVLSDMGCVLILWLRFCHTLSRLCILRLTFLVVICRAIV